MTTINTGKEKIEMGLSILIDLYHFLDTKLGDEMTDGDIGAAIALCQKAGATLENGLRSHGLLSARAGYGSAEGWLGLNGSPETGGAE